MIKSFFLFQAIDSHYKFLSQMNKKLIYRLMIIQKYQNRRPKLKVNYRKTEIIETPIDFITFKDEPPMLSSIDENIEPNRHSLTTIDEYSADQDLQLFLNSLLSYLLPDVFDVYSISSDQLKYVFKLFLIFESINFFNFV